MATIDLGKIKQVWRGTYNNGTAYTVDDLVAYTDSGILSTYICVTNSTGNAPSSSGTAHASWNYVSKGVADPIPSQSGNSGKVLKTDGSSISWGTDVGGKILQVVQSTANTRIATTSTSYVATVNAVTITPTAASSKIKIEITGIGNTQSSNRQIRFNIFRSINGGTFTAIAPDNSSDHGFQDLRCSGSRLHANFHINYLDTPSYSVGNAIIYKLYVKSQDGGEIEMPGSNNAEPTVCIAMEIAA